MTKTNRELALEALAEFLPQLDEQIARAKAEGTYDEDEDGSDD